MFLKAIFAIFASLPELISMYKTLKGVLGDNFDKFMKDVEDTVRIVEESKKEGLTIEQKRSLRRSALEKGHGIWSRIAN